MHPSLPQPAPGLKHPAQPQLREFADQAFSRAAGAPLVGGNEVRLLKDAQENYAAWLHAIRSARRSIHFECYFICEDDIGREFAEALVEKARGGVAVKVVYDWFGNLGKASGAFWDGIRAAGAEVRCYNPPQLESPLGWLSRDHRKMLVVDAGEAFVSGLCVGDAWLGDAARGIAPWRDTGIGIRGPIITWLEQAFADTWDSLGTPLAAVELSGTPAAASPVLMRIVASEPSTAGMLRLDQLVAALARRRLWLTDAYFAGMTTYIQALRAAAGDGVDVRLLVPNATDIPLLRPLSRAGYRPLLEAGVHVFEWNGTMLHAKTAVADGRWARVGSTNLNAASWLGNRELDAVVEDEPFAREMEAMYEEDLANATEIVLDARRRVSAPGAPHHARAHGARSVGSASRAAAGAVRLGHAIGAAFTSPRVLGPVEARLTIWTGAVLCALAVLFAFFPHVLAYPMAALGAWAGMALLYRGYRLHRDKDRQ